jgi:single-strand DNA-binding protein
MHTITTIGHLGKDPEERVTTNGLKLITFSLAVQIAKDKTIWYDCNIWDEKMALFSGIIPHLKKGSKVLVMGDLSTPEIFQTKTGEAKIKNKIQPFSIKFVPSGDKKEEGKPSPSAQGGGIYQQPNLGEGWEHINAENIPF